MTNSLINNRKIFFFHLQNMVYNVGGRRVKMAIITKTSVKDQVYSVIKQKIFNQEYDFGDTINITNLSRELGVSNTPIREALSRLEVEGLVVSTMSTKVQVINPDEKLFNEIASSFFVMVFGAYGLCRMSDRVDELISLMDEALEAQRAALSAGDYGDFVYKSIAFDRTFVAATGNEKMLSIYDGLSSMLYLLTRHVHQQTDTSRQENLAQHEAIREAVVKGDQLQVEKLMFHHFDKHR